MQLCQLPDQHPSNSWSSALADVAKNTNEMATASKVDRCFIFVKIATQNERVNIAASGNTASYHPNRERRPGERKSTAKFNDSWIQQCWIPGYQPPLAPPPDELPPPNPLPPPLKPPELLKLPLDDDVTSMRGVR